MKRSLLLLALAGCGDDAGSGTACEADSAYVAAHAACNTDADCVVVGSCSSWGFHAVQISSQAEAERRAGSSACQLFDGPTYDAVCEQLRCTLRATGHYCGEPADAGIAH